VGLRTPNVEPNQNTNRAQRTEKGEQRLVPSRLHAIVDVQAAAAAGWEAAGVARAFLDGGARLLQIRAKDLSPGVFLDLCDTIVDMAAGYDAAVIVNDRVDIARMAGAAGAHVGQDDLPPAAARAQLGPGAIVGYSTHTIAQIDDASRQPVSYIAVGPVFGTRTKDTGYEAVGLGLVSAAAAGAGDIPLVAIGGITLENAASAIAAGAASVAVISDLLVGGNPTERVRQFLAALGHESRAFRAATPTASPGTAGRPARQSRR
jgi:thiamine-phosphate pyrophosphorylase